MKEKILNSIVTLIIFLIPVAVFVLLTKIEDHKTYIKKEPEVVTPEPEPTARIYIEREASSTFVLASSTISYDEARVPVIQIMNGIVVGSLSFIEGSVLSPTDPYLSLIISDASSRVDVLITSFTFNKNSKLKMEDQQKLAHSAIDSGATLVGVVHPQASEGQESYNKGLILYGKEKVLFDTSVTKNGIVQ